MEHTNARGLSVTGLSYRRSKWATESIPVPLTLQTYASCADHSPCSRNEIKYATGRPIQYPSYSSSSAPWCSGQQSRSQVQIAMSTNAGCPRRSHDLRCRSNRYNYGLSIKETYDKHTTTT